MAFEWKEASWCNLQHKKLQHLGQIVIAIVAISPAQVLRRDPDSLVGEQQVKGAIHLARVGEQGRGTRGKKLHLNKPQMQLQLDGARDPGCVTGCRLHQHSGGG